MRLFKRKPRSPFIVMQEMQQHWPILETYSFFFTTFKSSFDRQCTQEGIQPNHDTNRYQNALNQHFENILSRMKRNGFCVAWLYVFQYYENNPCDALNQIREAFKEKIRSDTPRSKEIQRLLSLQQKQCSASLFIVLKRLHDMNYLLKHQTIDYKDQQYFASLKTFLDTTLDKIQPQPTQTIRTIFLAYQFARDVFELEKNTSKIINELNQYVYVADAHRISIPVQPPNFSEHIT